MITNTKALCRTAAGVYQTLTPDGQVMEIKMVVKGSAMAARIGIKETWSFSNAWEGIVSVHFLDLEMVWKFLSFPQIDLFGVTVETDLTFTIQADGTYNPSFITAVFLTNTSHQLNMTVGGYDLIKLTIDSHTPDTLACSGANPNGCGEDDRPELNSAFSPIALLDMWIAPQGPGSDFGTLPSNPSTFMKNKFTLKGKYYYLQRLCKTGNINLHNKS